MKDNSQIRWFSKIKQVFCVRLSLCLYAVSEFCWNYFFVVFCVFVKSIFDVVNIKLLFLDKIQCIAKMKLSQPWIYLVSLLTSVVTRCSEKVRIFNNGGHQI